MGERIADRAAAIVISWRFIIDQTILVATWVILSIVAWDYKWDAYPFILLNLMFSVQAAYTGPIVLLASDRQAAQAAIDRALTKRDDEELAVIYTLQQEQMQILSLLKDAQEKHTQLLAALPRWHEAMASRG